jgi:hypothetical protein
MYEAHSTVSILTKIMSKHFRIFSTYLNQNRPKSRVLNTGKDGMARRRGLHRGIVSTYRREDWSYGS